MDTLYLSKSRLNTFAMCPEKFRLLYVEKLVPEKTPVAMVEGSALHHIVENCLVYGKNVKNIAEAVSNEYWSGIDIQKTEYENEEKFVHAQSSILDEAKYFVSQIGELNTYQMETYFEKPLIHPLTGEIDDSIVLRGYADIIDAPEKDVIRVIDLKTSAKSPNSEQANRAFELSVYAYLVATTYGFHIEFPVSLLYLVRSKQPKVVWLNSQRNTDDYITVYNTVQNIATVIRQGLYWKNHGMHCSWCQMQDVCFAKSQKAA